VSTRFLVDVESVLGTTIAYGRPSQMDLTLGCYMCMLGQEWDLPKELRRKSLLITETGLLISILAGYMSRLGDLVNL